MADGGEADGTDAGQHVRRACPLLEARELSGTLSLPVSVVHGVDGVDEAGVQAGHVADLPDRVGGQELD